MDRYESPLGRKREDIRGHHYSHWCALFRDFAEGRGVTNASLAEAVDSSQFLIHAWMTGKQQPPMDHRLVALSDALELEGDERYSFELEAYLARCPEWIQHKMRELTDENRALKKKLAGATLNGQAGDPEVLG